MLKSCCLRLRLQLRRVKIMHVRTLKPTHTHIYTQELAAAETKRTINSYSTGIALKMAKAGSQWAFKFLEYFTPSDMSDIEIDMAVATAKHHKNPEVSSLAFVVCINCVKDCCILLLLQTLSSIICTSWLRNSGPTVVLTMFTLLIHVDFHTQAQGANHPSSVISYLHKLAEPLQMVDQAARDAGNQLGLSAVDDDVKDVMEAVSVLCVCFRQCVCVLGSVLCVWQVL